MGILVIVTENQPPFMAKKYLNTAEIFYGRQFCILGQALFWKWKRVLFSSHIFLQKETQEPWRKNAPGCHGKKEGLWCKIRKICTLKHVEILIPYAKLLIALRRKTSWSWKPLVEILMEVIQPILMAKIDFEYLGEKYVMRIFIRYILPPRIPMPD